MVGPRDYDLPAAARAPTPVPRRARSALAAQLRDTAVIPVEGERSTVTSTDQVLLAEKRVPDNLIGPPARGSPNPDVEPRNAPRPRARAGGRRPCGRGPQHASVRPAPSVSRRRAPSATARSTRAAMDIPSTTYPPLGSKSLISQRSLGAQSWNRGVDCPSTVAAQRRDGMNSWPRVMACWGIALTALAMSSADAAAGARGPTLLQNAGTSFRVRPAMIVIGMVPITGPRVGWHAYRAGHYGHIRWSLWGRRAAGRGRAWVPSDVSHEVRPYPAVVNASRVRRGRYTRLWWAYGTGSGRYTEWDNLMRFGHRYAWRVVRFCGRRTCYP
jgi:hypothetical protein